MEASSTVIRRMQSHSGFALIAILMDLGIAAWQALAEWQRRTEARNELRRLSDRALKDIGLERAQIEGLFRKQ